MTEYEALLVLELSRTLESRLEMEFMGRPLEEVRAILRSVYLKVEPINRRASREEILSMLYAIASAFNVELPTEAGLKLIVTSLCEAIPARLVSVAAERVIATHRFKTMPTPAEITAGIEEEAAAIRLFLLNINRGGSKINSVLAKNRAFVHHIK